MQVLDDTVDVEALLAALGAAEDSPNPTLQAIATAYPAASWTLLDTIAFSSARKWSAATFDGHGTWILGAPEVVLGATHPDVLERAEQLSSAGSRVLLVGPPPRGESAKDPLRVAGDALAAMLADFAETRGVTYLDARAVFVAEDGSTRDALMAGDRIHLTPAGYDALGAAIAERLR